MTRKSKQKRRSGLPLLSAREKALISRPAACIAYMLVGVPIYLLFFHPLVSFNNNGFAGSLLYFCAVAIAALGNTFIYVSRNLTARLTGRYFSASITWFLWISESPPPEFVKQYGIKENPYKKLISEMKRSKKRGWIEFASQTLATWLHAALNLLLLSLLIVPIYIVARLYALLTSLL